MAATLVKIDVHIVFHIKTTSVEMRKDDIPLIHKYIGGIIGNQQSVPVCIGGVADTCIFSVRCPKRWHCPILSAALRPTQAVG